MKKTLIAASAAAALTAALVVPAMADTSLYGSARVTTFWNMTDKDSNADNKSDTDLIHGIQGNSRLGVNFSQDRLGGKVEIGAAKAFSSRHLYGTYKFDAGTLLVGQTENPYYFYSDQVANGDNVNNNYGALWDTRQAQVKFTMNNGFYISAIEPSVQATGLGTNKDVDIYLPKLCVGYEGKAGNFAYGAGVVGQTYKDIALDEDILSAMLYFHGKVAAGPATIKFNVGAGQNTGNMGFTNANATATNKYTGGEDTTSIEGFVQAGFAASPTVAVNVGAGYAMDDNDSFANTDNRMLVFVNAPITLAKGVSITPEITYIDHMDQHNDSDGGSAVLVGAKWQISF